MKGPLRLAGPALAALAAAAAGQSYIVADGTGGRHGWDRPGALLARHRGGKVIAFDPADPAELGRRLAKLQPRHAALLVRPDQLDYAFVRAFLQAATELDRDPFVDISFGYITGASPDAALRFVQRSITRDREGTLSPRLARAGVWSLDRSSMTQGLYPLGGKNIPCLTLRFAGGRKGKKIPRDLAFIEKHLPLLEACNLVLFGGHGLPEGIDRGPTYKELAGLDLAGAVALNVACYTGVTGRWYRRDWRTMTFREQKVDPARSFCLALLDRGVVGYTAYTCPRPAGPELDTDLCALAAGGATLGEARRRDYDKTVLGHLGAGRRQLRLEPLGEGTPFRRSGDMVVDFMLPGATGGILFGDPALRPFPPIPGGHPLTRGMKREGGAARITLACPARQLFLLCADPTANFRGKPAMKLYGRFDLGGDHPRQVELLSLRLGDRRPPARVVWALEKDRGRCWLQVKVNFPRPAARPAAAKALLRVELSPREGPDRGFRTYENKQGKKKEPRRSL